MTRWGTVLRGLGVETRIWALRAGIPASAAVSKIEASADQGEKISIDKVGASSFRVRNFWITDTGYLPTWDRYTLTVGEGSGDNCEITAQQTMAWGSRLFWGLSVGVPAGFACWGVVLVVERSWIGLMFVAWLIGMRLVVELKRQGNENDCRRWLADRLSS